MTEEQIFKLSATEKGERVDRFIAQALPDLSRSAVQRLIDEGQVTVNDAVLTQAAYKLRAGDAIVVRVPPPVPATVTPEALPLDILYEDADMLVLNKAAGMVVHPGAGNLSGTLVAVLGMRIAGMGEIAGGAVDKTVACGDANR
jgi:23S rRNA pseudouridine1911/1915/1917 synthase